MPEKNPIKEISRQPLVRGTSCFTDPAGEVGYKHEDIKLSALVRIADALERPALPNSLTLAEHGELHVLRHDMVSQYSTLHREYSGEVARKLLRLCELVDKLLGGNGGLET